MTLWEAEKNNPNWVSQSREIYHPDKRQLAPGIGTYVQHRLVTTFWHLRVAEQGRKCITGTHVPNSENVARLFSPYKQGGIVGGLEPRHGLGGLQC